MQYMLCAICGKDQQPQLLYNATLTGKNISAKTFSARRNPDKVHYQLNKCKKCGLIFSSPIFPSEKIINLYTESFLSYQNKVSFVTKTYLGLFNGLIKGLPNEPSILEIGCGDGFFLKALHEKGFNKLYGVEPSKKMVEAVPHKLRRNVKQSIFRKGLFPKNSFNIICCFHTLDHVIDPNELVKETYELLKVYGLALFVLHNTNAFSVKLFGEKSPIFDIEHIYLFNKVTITKLFKKHGFTIISIDDLRNTYPISYWVQMAGIPFGIKSFAIKLLLLTKLSNLPFSLKGGNMYIVAQKE